MKEFNIGDRVITPNGTVGTLESIDDHGFAGVRDDFDSLLITYISYLKPEKENMKTETKEIHFYTNLCNSEQVSDWDLDTMCTDYVSTQIKILDPDENIVKTTQLSFLNNSWDYIDNGWKVFIHNGSDVLEVKEKMDGTEKEIRKGHNISKLLIGGSFGKIE